MENLIWNNHDVSPISTTLYCIIYIVYMRTDLCKMELLIYQLCVYVQSKSLYLNRDFM